MVGYEFECRVPSVCEKRDLIQAACSLFTPSQGEGLFPRFSHTEKERRTDSERHTRISARDPLYPVACEERLFFTDRIMMIGSKQRESHSFLKEGQANKLELKLKRDTQDDNRSSGPGNRTLVP